MRAPLNEVRVENGDIEAAKKPSVEQVSNAKLAEEAMELAGGRVTIGKQPHHMMATPDDGAAELRDLHDHLNPGPPPAGEPFEPHLTLGLFERDRPQSIAEFRSLMVGEPVGRDAPASSESAVAWQRCT